MTRARQRGASLLEVLVAMTLFAIVATGVTGFAVQSMRRTSENRAATSAILLAQQEVESLRGLEYDDIATHSQGATVAGRSYGVATNVMNDTPAAGMKQLTVTVSWTTPIGPRSYVLHTILTALH